MQIRFDIRHSPSIKCVLRSLKCNDVRWYAELDIVTYDIDLHKVNYDIDLHNPFAVNGCQFVAPSNFANLPGGMCLLGISNNMLENVTKQIQVAINDKLVPVTCFSEFGMPERKAYCLLSCTNSLYPNLDYLGHAEPLTVAATKTDTTNCMTVTHINNAVTVSQGGNSATIQEGQPDYKQMAKDFKEFLFFGSGVFLTCALGSMLLAGKSDVDVSSTPPTPR